MFRQFIESTFNQVRINTDVPATLEVVAPSRTRCRTCPRSGYCGFTPVFNSCDYPTGGIISIDKDIAATIPQLTISLYNREGNFQVFIDLKGELITMIEGSDPKELTSIIVNEYINKKYIY